MVLIVIIEKVRGFTRLGRVLDIDRMNITAILNPTPTRRPEEERLKTAFA
ncbi:hypothetical protein NG798_13795 [Ancylothrix sp. C2]|nr:hypothetical protein [Ancylothrix sp. D3o]